MTKRDEDGRFNKGVSGNPKGRPTKEEIARRGVPNSKLRKALKQLESHVTDAVQTLADLMTDKDAPATVRISAAKTILDKTESYYNALEEKAKEKVDTEDNDELPLAPVINFGQIVEPPKE